MPAFSYDHPMVSGTPRHKQTDLAAGAPFKPGSSSAYPETVQRLIENLAKLPGIGRRSAERLAFHILKTAAPEALELARAISDVKRTVRHCSVCFSLADADSLPAAQEEPTQHPAPPASPVLCSVCRSSSRDRSVVMVVEQPKDLIALEQTGMYKGVYHVLMGRISPLDGVGPGDLTIGDLLTRIKDPTRNTGGEPVREIVLALNPTLEADGTALYVAQQLSFIPGIKVTRLARGIPTGTQLEYANKAVLADAIEGSQPMG
jgi:recombination protein RecR